ncbi:M48 family metallopeptidase [Desulfovibrio sp. SGI.169]|uniref:M48 family metallopeptidase n=1 Tax=Desulfovibrio sp. SGI.169 TaxID=3420561 RepID=UPI003D011A23
MPEKTAAFLSPDAPNLTAVFTLADGARLTARVRRSPRARQARLSLAPDGALLLTAPDHWPAAAVERTLPRFLPWLERAWRRHRQHAPKAALPRVIVLPLPGLEFQVEPGGDLAEGRRRSQSCARSLLVSRGARRLLLLETPGRLRLFGPPEDAALGALALRRWCRGQAARLLPPYLLRLAAGANFCLSAVNVRDQRGRWGSCSRAGGKNAPPREAGGFRSLLDRLTGRKSPHGRESAAHADAPPAAGRIALNWRALLLPVPLLEHLCWHELCHLRQMNHSPAFRAELARFSPRWPDMEKALTRAWRELPWWALHVSDPDAP